MKTINIYGDNRFAAHSRVREACRGIVIREGMLLLTYEVNTDQWFIPGGGLEAEETRRACCIRELEEETGFAVNPFCQFATIHEYYEEWLFVSHYFLCEITGETERALTEREAEVGLEPRWIPLQDAVAIFAKHQEYANDEMKRGAYLREFKALLEYLKTDRARSQTVAALMGRPVHVVVDRPIGYQHGNILYPINYGSIPGIISGDGEPQDAYILGVNEPIREFDGQVVAAIRRKNDCEDKLVVAPAGTVYHQGQIAQAVHFQEQYFVSTIDSLFRKSCGVIPFRGDGDEREYLILLQSNHCWSFPKGHMEAGETEEQTALRELHEETGLRARLIPGKRALSEYAIAPFTRKQVVLFLGETDGNVTVQQGEILSHRWVKAEELSSCLHRDTYEGCAELLR